MQFFSLKKAGVWSYTVWKIEGVNRKRYLKWAQRDSLILKEKEKKKENRFFKIQN